MHATRFTEAAQSWSAPDFAITLSAPPVSTVTVPWRISPGTATEGVDHAGYSYLSGTATFDPGETLQTVRLRINGDADIERDEAVVFAVGAPTGPATLPGGAAEIDTVGWIHDDDGTRTRSRSSWARRWSPRATAARGSPPLRSNCRGRRRAISTSPFPPSTEPPWREATTSRSRGSLRILEGQTSATIGVQVRGDTRYEGPEAFSLRLFLDGAIGQSHGGRATIGDDGSPTGFWLQTGTGGADRITGYAYRDDIRGWGGDDRISGYEGADRLQGNGGDDQIWGGGGADTILGGDGNDRIWAGAHSDFANRGRGNDRIWGGTGNDHLRGGSGNDILRGEGGNDRLHGESGNDLLIGGDGRDRLDGGNGSDILQGGAGNDILIAGKGNDVSTGGSGADLFVFARAEGFNRITDFQDGIDTIRITSGALGFGALNIRRDGDDVRVGWSQTAVVLEDVALAELGRDDFIFG